MALKVVFILALCLVACECHYFSSALHPDYWHLWQKYFDGDHPEKSLGSCSKDLTCGEGKICCLNNHQGHCFNNHLTISNSDICLTDDELDGNGLNSRCQKDSDCTDSGTWCEYNRSNKWGTCVYDLCSGINNGRCNDGDCTVSGDGVSEAHSFKCTCPDDKYGADCSIDHPCELTGFDAVCGSNGVCNIVTSFDGVYAEDVDEEDVFTCTCDFGWVGARCNHQHPCDKTENPCGDGYCAPEGDGYVCWCPRNSYGENCTQTCGGFVTSSQFPHTITSPEVDDEYPADIECEWIVTADVNNTVTLGFGSFELEKHPTCRWDSLTVTENGDGIGSGSGPADTREDGIYCGYEIANLTSGSIDMTILFSSDRKTHLSGFTAVIDQVPE